MVAAGPRPGSTPTAVPMTAPKNAKSMLPGVSAMKNPEMIPSKIFMPGPFPLYETNGLDGSSTRNR